MADISVPGVAERPVRALRAINSGSAKCKPGHSWGPGVRKQFLIHYVISGKGFFTCGGKRYEVYPGQIFVIFPGHIVHYQADEQEPWHYAWIDFDGQEAMEVFVQTGISPERPVFTVRHSAQVMALFQDMPLDRSADLKENLRFNARLYEFLSLLLDSQQQTGFGAAEYLTTAIRYIKAHYTEDISVSRVAAQAGISRKYLFAIFKQALGISPMDYIVNYRMEQAAAFLRNRSLTIGQIAYSVGYNDAMTFSKMFRRRMGLSPSEYRRQNP